MSADPDSLYRLLPAIYRIRDNKIYEVTFIYPDPEK